MSIQSSSKGMLRSVILAVSSTVIATLLSFSILLATGGFLSPLASFLMRIFPLCLLIFPPVAAVAAIVFRKAYHVRSGNERPEQQEKVDVMKWSGLKDSPASPQLHKVGMKITVKDTRRGGHNVA